MVQKQAFNEIFGRKLRFAREENDMTQTDLALALGYSGNNAISQIESGLKGMGKKKVLMAADILGVDPNDLLSSTRYSKRDMRMKMLLEKLIRAGEKHPRYEAVEDALLAASRKIQPVK